MEQNKESIATVVTELDLANAVVDDYGVLYSPDELRLLECRNIELQHYKVKDGCRVIADGAFFNAMPFNCILEEIIMPESLVAIGKKAFCGCGRMHTAVIREGLRYIGDYAFEVCLDLKQITLPSSLVDMGKNPFFDSAIVDITGLSPNYHVVDGCLMMQDEMVALLDIKEVVCVPQCTKGIRDDAFGTSRKIREMILPQGLEWISNKAFWGCQLKRLENQSPKINIVDWNFEKCPKPEEIIQIQ